jgi:hypothetical protein
LFLVAVFPAFEDASNLGARFLVDGSNRPMLHMIFCCYGRFFVFVCLVVAVFDVLFRKKDGDIS